MLPGKQYKPEDLLLIIQRRIWLLIVPCAIVAAGTALFARKLPDLFRSEAVILVVPQQVPADYVRSTVTSRIEDRLQSISQQILSRSRLEHVIDDFNLYVQERRTGIMEDVVEQMRRDITVQIVRGDSFRVAYRGSDPKTVQKVADRLSSLFIEENLRDRAVLAEGTDQFLETQLEDSRRNLQEHEKKLEDYRIKNSGQLPSQVGSNLQALQNVQMQIQATLDAINRDHDRRTNDERQLTDLQSNPVPTDAGPSSAPLTMEPGAEFAGNAGQQLKAARAALTALEARGLKPDHPDVVHLNRVIRDLQKTAEAEALTRPVTVAAEEQVSPQVTAEINRQRRMKELQDDITLIDKRMTANQEQEKRLRDGANEYQRRVDAVPVRESEMIELTRDYSTMQTMYSNLLMKKEEANIAANLERRQIGEQFKLLDPAQIPERPYSPDRKSITLEGVAAGLGLGLALVAFFEYRDSSFKADDEIAALLSLPVLAVVPYMQSDRERRRTIARRVIVGAGLVSTVGLCAAIVVYVLMK